VLTLEDIIEEIISEEIVDETDRYEDNRHHKRAKRMTTAAVMRGIVERSVRQRKAESVSTIGSPRTFENAPLLPGTSPEYGRFGQYGSLVSESPKS